MVWPGAATALLPTALIPSPAPAPARRRELSEVLAAPRLRSGPSQRAHGHARVLVPGCLLRRRTQRSTPPLQHGAPSSSVLRIFTVPGTGASATIHKKKPNGGTKHVSVGISPASSSLSARFS